MATTTKSSARPSTNGTSATIHPLLAKQQELVAAYGEQAALLAAAKEKGDKKAVGSHGARMSNLSQKIGQAQLDIRLANAEGAEIEFTEFVKPKSSSSSRSRPVVSKEQLESDLAKVGRIYNSEAEKSSVRHDCDVRITALLKQAERAGYSVSDPRK